MPSVPVDFLALSCFRGVCSSFRMRPFSITTSSDLLLRLSLHSSCFSLSFSDDRNVTNIPIIVSESVCCLLVCQQSFNLYRCCWASIASTFIIQLLGEFLRWVLFLPPAWSVINPPVELPGRCSSMACNPSLIRGMHLCAALRMTALKSPATLLISPTRISAEVIQ